MDLDQYIMQFDPIRDSSEWKSEDPIDYAKRMHKGLLPNWPTEVLIEWFYRHSPNIESYAFLKYEEFIFEKQKWKLAKIPGREAFADPSFCDNFMDIEDRAENPHDWLAHYMLEKGTWNTPIILLENARQIIAPSRLTLNVPFHLLEGHRRLSFLNGLRNIGRAQQQHFVWVVHLPDRTN